MRCAAARLMWLSWITVSLLSRHVWCRASTGELFVARRRRLATGAAQLRSDTVSATSEADASARRAKPRANKMAITGRNAVFSVVFSLRGGALNCCRCSLRRVSARLLEGQPSGPKRLATTRHWVPHGWKAYPFPSLLPVPVLPVFQSSQFLPTPPIGA